MIEGMCLACHGPILPARRDGRVNPRALFCTDNGAICRSAWSQSRAAGRLLPTRCLEGRVMHAFRREQEAIFHHVALQLRAQDNAHGEAG